MLNQLQLVQPDTVEEASSALAELGERAKVYAGGAELLLLFRNGLLDAEILVDVKKIARLHGINSQEDLLRIGACATHHGLERSELLGAHAPAFAYAESQVANVRVRNQGTLGGNLAFNDPHSDPATVLLIHDAWVSIANRQGERSMALSDFLVDMYATALGPGDLLLEINVPRLPPGMKSGYWRLHRYQRPTLGVAVGITTSGGALDEVRLAVGCAGPKAERLRELETKLKGATLADARQIVAGEKSYLRARLRPLDDLLGSAEYKLYMAGVMLTNAIGEAGRERNGSRA